MRSGIVMCCLLLGCTSPERGDAHEAADRDAAVDPRLLSELDRIDSVALAVDRIFQPLPLLTGAEESVLRRYSNAQHLARARALGVPRGPSAGQLRSLETSGRLVRLEDDRYWIVRELEQSQALVVPAVRAALTEIGERFHARLATLRLPAFRMELTSLLRTAGDQAQLRAVNPNAAAGESTHEFGTTFDVAYSAWAAPQGPAFRAPVTGSASSDSVVARYARIAVERVAARRALELKAVFGKVLIEMQREGRILVTIERLQPVFHITVAR